MKSAVAILIFLSLLTQCLARLGVIGYYQLNKSYIAKNLCENKDKPQMKCCGKCYLRKQLKKVEENESPAKNAPVKVEKNEVLTYIIPSSLIVAQGTIDFPVNAARTPVFQHLFHRSIPFPVFHPPSIAC